MLSLHLSPKTARVSIAVCTLVAAAACNGDGVTAPPDFTLTPIVTFDDLKAALVEARNEQNGGVGPGMWAAVVDRRGPLVSLGFPRGPKTHPGPRRPPLPRPKANTPQSLRPPPLPPPTPP